MPKSKLSDLLRQAQCEACGRRAYVKATDNAENDQAALISKDGWHLTEEESVRCGKNWLVCDACHACHAATLRRTGGALIGDLPLEAHKSCAFLSIGHLRAEDVAVMRAAGRLEWQKRNPDVSVIDYGHGLIIRNVGQEGGDTPAWALPHSTLVRFFIWAREKKYDMLQFDADGEVMPEWPTYVW